MTTALTKYFFKNELLMKLFKIMNILQLSRFCFCFTLRQGTILIAILELTFTTFVTFLLILGSVHAQDIIDTVSADLKHLEESNEFKEAPLYILNNEKKMLIGQQLGFMIVVLVYMSVILAIIHIVSCILLLYGALKNAANFFFPWVSTTLFSLLSGSFFLFMIPFFPFSGCKFGTFALGLFLLGLETHSWLVVFSYYKHLRSQGLETSEKVQHFVNLEGNFIKGF